MRQGERVKRKKVEDTETSEKEAKEGRREEKISVVPGCRYEEEEEEDPGNRTEHEGGSSSGSAGVGSHGLSSEVSLESGLKRKDEQD